MYRLDVTKDLNPTKKGGVECILIKQLLNLNGIVSFYHFTEENNLENIKKYGGLLSWKLCDENKIKVSSFGGNSLSRQLDTHHNLQDYVHLSFCTDHPMAYRHKIEGKKLVLLEIKIDVALWQNTLFSDMNAIDNNHSHGGTYSDLKKIKFSAVKRNYVSREDEDFKYHQAEILVKNAIPKEFIVNLYNPKYL